MTDLPGLALTATIWAYWFGVGVMIVRVRRHTRKLSGVVPQQRLEQLMWLVWVPVVVAWMVLPYLAATRAAGVWGLPEFARDEPYASLRWAGVAMGFVSLALSIECWARMGRNWRMAVTPDQQTDLVTTGLYGYIRHPIYTLSILLMLCTALVLPTLPVFGIAVVHIALMVGKARNEERFMAGAHGERYRRYRAQTGRFFPRFRRPADDSGGAP